MSRAVGRGTVKLIGILVILLTLTINWSTCSEDDDNDDYFAPEAGCTDDSHCNSNRRCVRDQCIERKQLNERCTINEECVGEPEGPPLPYLMECVDYKCTEKTNSPINPVPILLAAFVLTALVVSLVCIALKYVKKGRKPSSAKSSVRLHNHHPNERDVEISLNPNPNH